jgi:hypothetical protein
MKAGITQSELIEGSLAYNLELNSARGFSLP